MASAVLLVFAAAVPCTAQNAATGDSVHRAPSAGANTTSSVDLSVGRPLPDVVTMMQEVQRNERKAEAIQKDYIYHSVTTEQSTDSAGRVKKTLVSESDHYWSNGVPVARLIRKDGKDLSAGELAKEDEKIRREVQKAREHREKLEAEGKPTDAGGHDIMTVSRALELGRFANPRRVQLDGRDTIAVDYEGNPSARTRNRAEELFRDLRGTLWVDENDRLIVRAEGYFANGVKIGGGLLANIQKGTHFQMRQAKVNDEVWIPSHVEAQGGVRALLFFNFAGRVRVDYSGFRKLRTSSVVLPGATKVDDSEAPHVATP